MNWSYQPFLSGAGQGAALNFAADPGQYSITPQMSQISYTRRIMASGGTFSLSATSPITKAARILFSDGGAVSLTGGGAGFSHVPVVSMEGGNIACQFQPCAITMKRRLAAGHHLVRVIGQSAMQADASQSRSSEIGLSVGF